MTPAPLVSRYDARMNELPPPDLMDEGGRLKRLALALLVGAAAGAAAYLVCDHLARPDTMPGGYDGGHQLRAFKFVFYMVGFFGVAGFLITLSIANARAKKKWHASLVARAEVVRKDQ
jgi:hypothetical protein